MSTPSTPSTPSAPASRLGWVDSARGVCVFGVVVFHVCLWHYLPVFTDGGWQPAVSVWGRINSYLASLRMPLLLAISGMLASRRVGEGWGRPGAVIRAVSSYYLYVVWLIVYFAFFAVIDDDRLPGQVSSWSEFGVELVAPNTPLWYVFALAVYVVVLTSVRRVPVFVVLPVLAVISVGVLAIDPGWGMAEKIPENAVFFAAGVYGRDLLRNLSARRSRRDLVLTGAVACSTVLLARWSWGATGDAVMHVVRGLAFVGFGSLVVVQLCRWRAFARATEFIGRRTLQIYVLHVPLIMLTIAVLTPDRVRDLAAWVHNPAVSVGWPIVLTMVTVVLCLVLHRVLRLLRLNVLFDMPAAVAVWLRRRHQAWSRSGGDQHTPGAATADGSTAAPVDTATAPDTSDATASAQRSEPAMGSNTGR